MEPENPGIFERLRTLLLGSSRNLHDRGIFHKLSLIAFFAWVGLGSDGLSSSCYGPQASFLELRGNYALGLFVALATGLTIIIIAASYSQIIELFPTGGGGYLVASKLLSPRVGAVSGCALLVDYVLTISVSVASGSDAAFSYLPEEFKKYKLAFAVLVLLVMMMMNLRGVHESVAPLVPIFLVFVLTHAFAIIYAIASQPAQVAQLPGEAISQARSVVAEHGWFGQVGLLFVLLHAFGMGAGTYTGLEAVSNGLPILREPRVKTAHRTMTYMWVSLSIVVVGFSVAYLCLHVSPDPSSPLYQQMRDGKVTMNAVMFQTITGNWGTPGQVLLWVALLSETALLFAAAQTGFLDGPRVMANMALDRWLPGRLSMLSDRLVTQNGILLMAAAALVTMLMSEGKVELLLVLYSINVFITFVLSQTGMVRHWWILRREVKGWLKKLAINGVGLVLCLLILAVMIVLKFDAGGWVTLVVTGTLVVFVGLIRRHYRKTGEYVQRLDRLAQSMQLLSGLGEQAAKPPELDPSAKTAIVLVSGFNGLGVHAVLNVIRFFGTEFRNFAFVSVGVVDAGNFKGAAEVANLREHLKQELDKYVAMMRQYGYYAEGFPAIGTDIVDEVEQLAPKVLERFPRAVFFAGQIIFPSDSMFSRLLHNNIVFAVQQRLYRQGVPFVILPVRA